MKIAQNLQTNPQIKSFTTTLNQSMPTICIVSGTIGSVAALVLTWVAAKKHNDIFSAVKENIDSVRETKPQEILDENGKVIGYDEIDEDHTIKIYRKNLFKAYAKGGWEGAKLYGPPLAIEAASIALIFSGFGVLNTRYTAALAESVMLKSGYDMYRRNVVEALGEEADNEFRLGLKERTFESPDLDKNGVQKLDKDGNPKTKKEKALTLDKDPDESGAISPTTSYAMVFSRNTSKQFDYNRETGWANELYNQAFLNSIQENFDRKLKVVGHVWLSDVCEALGFEIEQEEWRYTGWYYDENCPIGDNRVDLRIQPICDVDGRRTGAYLIDPNVDGNIMRYVFRKDRNRNDGGHISIPASGEVLGE